MNYKNKSLCRVRTITLFLSLTKDKNQWQQALQEAKQEFDLLIPTIQNAGYEIQSIRIVTNAFGEYLDTTSVEKAKADLAYIKQLLNQLNNSGLRIRFAIGEAKTAQEIQLLPALIQDYGDLCNACVNVPLDKNGVLDNQLIEQSAQTIKTIAETTERGEGNFNFTVNFNCKPFIPYFPASYHSSDLPNSFVIGFETPDLLVAVLENIPKTEHNSFFNNAYNQLSEVLQYHIDEVLNAVHSVTLSGNFTFVGIDSSAAPSKNCASMVTVYENLGVPYFGAAGTVEASALLTRVFKSIKNVPLVGFSGLMLALTEDTGLAKGSQLEQFDIRALLTYSAVCGIGLDTVPVSGNATIEQLSALMRDTGTMAFRLNKPLTVRVFPIPNAEAGEMTTFESDDLCNSKILAIP
ncbi:DUF711 family protein [Phocoenobacter skyensis]|uniref:DUF711 family protein n=1 Tax=Phocoenobacter skyensis TaxID=97481 RepID=A0A1H7ZHV5_9PAST|nr:DUF711 family protein [Pasteurella skyensis]MDP8079868.1 DUF711 family protein [Pasteurella skyensis]MDP8085810.1 DUF711 family protein [Pasteurella skyensis]MDP8185967.1 DUF711 family protein [Pasteurella skyensis]QLB21896.1 hypothetical protein A6B44_01180 [Pasteurella skyensis]SEM57554.1 hypothetical protein SAMN05444853_12526 [Pasteurella skyensis]